MIESVERMEMRKAIDLPPVFSMLIGNERYSFEVESTDATHVYIINHETGELLNATHDTELNILIPDSWNDPITQMEIYLGLKDRGML